MATWLDPEQWDLWSSIALFAGTTLCIALAGWRMTANADRLADRTGLGEAVAGAVLLGAATSIPGIITSAVTILMTGVLLMGLVRREKSGVWNIGFESFTIAVIYLGTIAILIFS